LRRICAYRGARPVLRTEADLRACARAPQTSDIGEAFRPVVHPYVVTAAYGVSWAYLAGDVGFETWKARRRGPSPLEACAFTEHQRLALVAVKRGSFQAIASMCGPPAFTIHTINTFNPRVARGGRTLTGLAAVPILPFLFDTPVEKATDAAFELARAQVVRAPRGTESLKKKEL
ncbi:mitochondrial 18 KDa protein-domain-containing protein, partial [Phellopilus nigrolimitatus]